MTASGKQFSSKAAWAVGLGAAALLLAVTWPRASGADTPPAAAPAQPLFPSAQVALGAQLAAVGNCAGCHTADPARPLAGGVPLPTPFGTVYSTNITPDATTGLGGWTELDFRRAMREGIARDGHKLYPAFPYPYFARLSDGDIAALYAYVMTREPITQAAQPNKLVFPVNIRALVGLWNLLYLDPQPYQADAGKDAQWNRGAYLVKALGHCGACHSPRNALGAEKKDQYLAGGEAEGWYSPGLDDAHTPTPQPWSVAQLAAYLRHGMADNHAIAGGPMQTVVAGLAQASEADIQALATYIHALQSPPSDLQQSRERDSLRRARQGPLASLQPGTPSSSTKDDQLQQLGAGVYAGACASCHDGGRQAGSAGALQLPLAVAVYDPEPDSLVRIVLQGITPPAGQTGRWMPAFAGELTDQQVTALAAYLRRQAADLPPWPRLAQAVQQARDDGNKQAH